MHEATLFRTSVETPASPHPIQPHEGCVLLGSCFAQEMGSRMSAYGLRVLCNPTGTLYNPASIAMLVHQALKGDAGRLPVFESGGRWRCWLAGTQVEEATHDAIISTMTHELKQLEEALTHATYLFITLGTNVCYRLQENGEVVANCHKMPARLFLEDTLSLKQCTGTLSAMTDELLQANPNLHITFTVSPYRYAKYGFHRSQIAKATLLLAVEEVCQKQSAASYFPAYEILMDELRDYRFYEADMLHPSHVAVDYIWERFTEWAFSPTLTEYATERERLRRDFAHHILHPESPEAQAFLRQREARRQAFLEKYGGRFAT